jgi:hypothetical protein
MLFQFPILSEDTRGNSKRDLTETNANWREIHDEEDA